jgi:hypothetical protein
MMDDIISWFNKNENICLNVIIGTKTWCVFIPCRQVCIIPLHITVKLEAIRITYHHSWRIYTDALLTLLPSFLIGPITYCFLAIEYINTSLFQLYQRKWQMILDKFFVISLKRMDGVYIWSYHLWPESCQFVQETHLSSHHFRHEQPFFTFQL